MVLNELYARFYVVTCGHMLYLGIGLQLIICGRKIESKHVATYYPSYNSKSGPHVINQHAVAYHLLNLASLSQVVVTEAVRKHEKVYHFHYNITYNWF